MLPSSSRRPGVVIAIVTAVGLSVYSQTSIRADQPPASSQQAGEVLTPVPQQAGGVAVVSFAELARQEAAQGRPSPTGGGRVHVHHGRQAPDELSDVALPAPAQPAAPRAVSPSPTLDFAGLDDISLDGYRYVPPDTGGAVGKDYIFNTLNNGYRILNKATGATVTEMSTSTFWSPLGITDVFDPRTTYDPYQDRFLTTAVGNAYSSSTVELIAVSNTNDPNGTWTMYKNTSAPTCTLSSSCWFDFPIIGFNQTWVVVSHNMFDMAGLFVEARVSIYPYTTLRSGASTITYYFQTLVDGDFSISPVRTYSSTESTLYLLEHWNSTAKTFRLHTITGTATSPSYYRGALQAHTMVDAWAYPGGDVLPQTSESGTGLTKKIDAGDGEIASAVFRNNSIWYAQTIGLPSGTYTHTAIQWGRMSTSGADQEVQRIDDSTATSTNGGKWYAYPSLAVNSNGDVLVGFSQFSSSQYASAGYAYRASADSATRDPVIYKSGQGFYYKTYSGTSNRWGDYSATQVDPSDDLTMWTVQEYAKSPTGTGANSGNWGTWWAKVARPTATSNPIMSLESPGNNSSQVQPFTISGWALDSGASSGSGVDAVHVYAYPSGGGSGQWVGAATLGSSRTDVAGVYGTQFTSSGFSLSANSGLTPGTYTLTAYAHSTVTGAGWNQSKSVTITIPNGAPAMAVDPPQFVLNGWAVDRSATTGTGVNAIHVWAFPTNGDAPFFIGFATYGISRPDVGAVYGQRFTNCGYQLTTSSLSRGRTYDIGVYAYSTYTNSFNQVEFFRVTLQ